MNKPQDLGRESFSNYNFSHFHSSEGEDPLDLVGPFSRWYSQARQEGYYLYQEEVLSAPSTTVQIKDGKTGELRTLLNLASYNYLGLSYRPEVKAAAVAAIERYGLGASGSPILSGTFEIHRELEEELSRFKKKGACLIFPSGYSANVGFISGLMRSSDTILLDQYAHASIVDGAILARSRTVFFRHNNAGDLERRLKRTTGKKLVVVEGVYSMDGDLCDLPAIVEVARRHGARILIDEAHSTFIYGAEGRGVAEHFGLEDEVDFHLGTFSKSLGGQGGFVCGSEALVDYISAYGKARFFSCNLAPVIAAGVLEGLRILQREPELRARLWHNVAFLRERLKEASIDVGDSVSQVVPVMVNDDDLIFPIAEALQIRGLFLNPVTHPAVPMHRSRLRISVSAAHTEAQLAHAADIISAVFKEVRP